MLLVEFDYELMSKKKDVDPNERGIAITLLVDHIHSIPVRRLIFKSVMLLIPRKDSESRAAAAQFPAVSFLVPRCFVRKRLVLNR